VPSSLRRVSFEDGAGIAYSVAVCAESLYEAAALALAEFNSGFVLSGVGPGTRLKVVVEAPTTAHELTVGKLEAWLNSNGLSPREQAKKVKLRQRINQA
jgi:hypothetical protein